jgi:endoribonuclease Dicer
MIPFMGVEEWADFGRKASTPQLNSAHALEPSVVHSIEQITGLKFQQPSLLRLTLVSRCASFER